MKINLKISFTLLLMAAGLSCKKGYFDQLPKDILNIEKVFNSRSTAEQFLANVYSQIPDEAHAHSAPDKNAGPWTAASDEAEYEWANTISNTINIGSFDATSGFVASYWTNYYRGIRNAGIFIQNVDKVTDMPLALKTQYKAEARALRALYYFNLLKIYGPVILLKDNIIAPDAPLNTMQIPRNTFDECVSYVVDELDAAANDLPMQPSANEDYGRITSGYALAIRSEVLLYAASPLYNGNKDLSGFINKDGKPLFNQQYQADKWTKAANAARVFIDRFVPAVYNLYRTNDAEGVYSPYLSCRDVFLVDWNAEIIYARIDAGITEWQYDTTPYHQGFPDEVRGAGSLGVTQNMVDAYFMANGRSIDDPEAGYLDSGESMFKSPYDDKMRLTFNQWVDREPRFYAQVTYNGSKWVNNELNDIITELYVDGNSGRATGGNDYSATGYIVRKNISTGARTNGNRTWVVLRLAEIYLNYAEALNESSPGNPEVIRFLNLLRNRAGIAEYGKDINTPVSQKAVRQAIRKERRIELAFENNRYFDVRRWMIAPSTDNGPMLGLSINAKPPEFNNHAVFENRVFQARNYFFPIPQSDIDNDKQLVQNPGW